jgi:hypothetical protein
MADPLSATPQPGESKNAYMQRVMEHRPLILRQTSEHADMNEELARLAYEGIWRRHHNMAVNRSNIRANYMNVNRGGRSYRKKRSGRSKRRTHRRRR